MKFLFLISTILFSLSVFADEVGDNPACDAFIDSLGVSKTPSADGSIRIVQLRGTTEDGGPCVLDFMPDFCTFQIGNPLKSPLMYYLQNTDDSSVKIKYRRGENFFLDASSKQVLVESWNPKKYIQELELTKSDAGYEFDFLWKEGKIVKDTLEKFSCSLQVVR